MIAECIRSLDEHVREWTIQNWQISKRWAVVGLVIVTLSMYVGVVRLAAVHIFAAGFADILLAIIWCVADQREIELRVATSTY